METTSVLELTEVNFEQEVVQAELPVLVDFWAEWCGPCRMVSPIVEALGEAYAGRVKVAKVDTDAHQALAEKFGIQAIPTLILFQDGEVVERFVGLQTKKALAGQLDKIVMPSEAAGRKQ